MRSGVCAWLTLLLVAGCHGTEPALQRGSELFSSTSFSVSPSNVFACATCHSTQASGDPSRMLPGYTLHDVTVRPSYWGGAYDTLLDAVNECYVEFMRGERLAPDNTDGRALLVYLESLATDAQAAALPLTVVQNIVDVPSGDATRGAATYQAACANCHGAIHSGDGRLGPNVTRIPDETIAQHMSQARLITIEKIRHGKFFTVGGNMAPYSLEAFSDEQVGDVLAYLGL